MRKIAANYIFPSNGRVIHNGYVEFDDEGRVLSVGELKEECESTEFYNGIICPGYTNAHCHIELSHLKGKFEQGTGMSGFINQINALRESVPASTRITLLEKEFNALYAEGVSAMADISNCDESFHIKSISPLYTRTYLEVFGTEPKDAQSVMDDVAKLEAKAKSMNLDAAPTPHSPYTMSPLLLEKASAAALNEGFLSYHNQESEEEDQMIISGTGALALNYKGRGLSTPPILGKPAIFHFLNTLQKIHSAPFEESFLLIHNTVSDAESIDAALSILKRVFWVTCPLSNIFIHRRVAPLYLLRQKGAKIAIGTDSLSSNTTLSMTKEIFTIQENFPEIPLEEILLWATLNGAEGIGKENTFGSFAIGKKPGALLIDNIDFRKMRLTESSTSRRII